ncbi:hypothetical protein [Brevundimonas sp. FT23028]|uniref:hypothetical protein n=1 Tax=Brevundimonas sp. FT23028 TaxID=3393748 RepID=UPI003B589636
MNRLNALLETLSRIRPNATIWCGAAPADAGHEALFERLSYRPSGREVRELSREDATAWLSLLAAHSLNHGIGRAEAIALLNDVEFGFEELSEGARFFSVGIWQVSRRGRKWDPLRAGEPWKGRTHMVDFSGPYVDGEGVGGAILGLDHKLAFVFGVVEDD